MSIFGEIADSILIGAACVVADVECAVSSMGISKNRAIGNNNNGGYKPVTDKKPTNPPEEKPTNPKNKEKQDAPDESSKHAANTNVEASMTNRPIFTPNNAGRYDINIEQMCGQSNDSTNVFRNPYTMTNSAVGSHQFDPSYPLIWRPVSGTAPVANPTVIQQAPVPIVPKHKVDEPKHEKPKSAPRNPDPTTIDSSTSQTVKDMVHIEAVKPNVTIDDTNIVPDVAPVDTTLPPPVSKFKGNQILIQNYPFLGDIERIALDNGYQIAFRYIDTINVIMCAVCNAETLQPIEGKGFVIDLGNIIDKRKKIFLDFPIIFERLPAYFLFAKSDKGNKLNSEFIKNLIVGGHATAANVKPMYTPEFLDLNAHVAMITLNSLNVNADDRRYIHDRLLKGMAIGIFNEVRHNDPLTRFRIARYDKKTKTIILDSAGVPLNYGQKYQPHPRHQILIEEKKMVNLDPNEFINVD